MASCNEYQVIYLLNLLPTLQPIFSLVKLFGFIISTTQNISFIYSVSCQNYLPDTAVAIVTILIHLLNWPLVWPWLPILPSVLLLCSCSELTSHNHRNIWCTIPELFSRCCWPVLTFLTSWFICSMSDSITNPSICATLVQLFGIDISQQLEYLVCHARTICQILLASLYDPCSTAQWSSACNCRIKQYHFGVLDPFHYICTWFWPLSGFSELDKV